MIYIFYIFRYDLPLGQVYTSVLFLSEEVRPDFTLNDQIILGFQVHEGSLFGQLPASLDDIRISIGLVPDNDFIGIVQSSAEMAGIKGQHEA